MGDWFGGRVWSFGLQRMNLTQSWRSSCLSPEWWLNFCMFLIFPHPSYCHMWMPRCSLGTNLYSHLWWVLKSRFPVEVKPTSICIQFQISCTWKNPIYYLCLNGDIDKRRFECFNHLMSIGFYCLWTNCSIWVQDIKTFSISVFPDLPKRGNKTMFQGNCNPCLSHLMSLKLWDSQIDLSSDGYLLCQSRVLSHSHISWKRSLPCSVNVLHWGRCSDVFIPLKTLSWFAGSFLCIINHKKNLNLTGLWASISLSTPWYLCPFYWWDRRQLIM